MKTFIIAALLLFLPNLGWCAAQADSGDILIQMEFQHANTDQQYVVIAMFDNPASRDFMALLPLTVEMSDFARTEKIASLPRRLNTKNSPVASELSSDFTYYAPWGNLAVFYQGLATDGQVYPLGRIVSGKEILANMNENFTVTIKKTNK